MSHPPKISKGITYDEALAYYQKALTIRIKVLGEEHPDVATSYNNIGLVLGAQGKYDEALVYCQKDLKISLKVLSEGASRCGKVITISEASWLPKENTMRL